MTIFIKRANQYQPSPDSAIDIHPTLPPNNFVIGQDNFGNLFFEQIESFSSSKKLYGDFNRKIERIYNTFLNRKSATGVLLAGEKGSGKSLMAKELANRASRDGHPTIVINSPWVGDNFNKLIQSVNQPCVVLFDEFEKVYDSDEQEKVLTLLDGVFPSNKLFVITCNEYHRIDYHMKNRPGRSYYMLDFGGLDIQFVREYCADNLVDQEQAESVCKVASLFNNFNFDMLKALIEEMNRYNEPASESVKMLNARPRNEGRAEFDINLYIDGKLIAQDKLETNGVNPFEDFSLWYYDEEDKSCDAKFSTRDVVKIDQDTQTFIFFNGKDRVELVRVKKPLPYDYYGVF